MSSDKPGGLYETNPQNTNKLQHHNSPAEIWDVCVPHVFRRPRKGKWCGSTAVLPWASFSFPHSTHSP